MRKRRNPDDLMKRLEKLRTPKNAQNHSSTTLVERFHRSLWFLIFEIAAFISVIAAMAMLVVDLQDRREERLARAWQLLTTVAPGNSGKIQAMEYLVKKGIPLSGIDLSEEQHGGTVFLRSAEIGSAILNGANLSGAELWDANLSGAVMYEADLTGAFLNGANLSGADLSSANLSGTSLYEANLSGANLVVANFNGTNLFGAKLDGAFICSGVIGKQFIVLNDEQMKVVKMADC